MRKLLPKIIFFLLVAFAIASGTFAYLYLKKVKTPTTDAVALMPDSCLVYAQSKNLKNLLEQINSQNIIFDKLKSNGFYNKLSRELVWIDSLLNSASIIKLNLPENTIHFAYYNNYKDWIITSNFSLINAKDIENTLVTTLNASSSETHYSFKTSSNQIAYCVFFKGVLIFSNNQDLLQKCIDKNNKLITNSNFKEFYASTKTNSDVTFFINHHLINTCEIKLSAIKNLKYETLTINLEPSSIAANGYLNTDSTCILELCKGIKPIAFNDDEALPSSAIEFTKFTFNNNHLGKANYWETINDSALFDMRQEFYANFNSSLTEFKVKNQFQSQLLVSVDNASLLQKHLSFICDSSFLYNTYKIYVLKKKSQLFYPISETEFGYFTYGSNSICFSVNLVDALSYANMIQEGKTLSKNVSFIAYKAQQLSEAYNYIHYHSPNGSGGTINNFIRLEKSAYQNFKHFSYTLVNYKNNFKSRANLKYESENEAAPINSLWQCRLDTTLSGEINSFYNHNTKQNEIVVQDNFNQLYLIDNKGNTLWKTKLNEQICSKIYKVDIFKNGKFQMLFNTENYLHLVDRNGKYVSGYPVKLPDAATNQLSLFDYDNEKNYRIFIACKNKKIYNYTIYGLKQEGFLPFVCDNNVKLPMHYVKVGLSDYIVAVDELGKIYTISRKGEGRIGLKNKTIENCSEFFVDASNSINSTFLVYVDTKNDALHKISFSDKKELVKLTNPIPNANIQFDLLDENRTMDVLVSNQNQLLGYDFNGNLIFEKDYKLEEPSKSVFLGNENVSYLATYFEVSKLIKVSNLTSNKILSFEASAKPLFYNLFNDNKPYLIYANGSFINCCALY